MTPNKLLVVMHMQSISKASSSGHMLADCPGAIENGGKVEAPNAGQCYKCGSLEHSSRYE